MRFRLARALALAFLPALASSSVLAADSGEVNVYSYRQPYLIDPLFKEFTDETGIKVNVIFAEKGLIERMAAEGRNSPADVLLTVDVGNLTQAKTRASASRRSRRSSKTEIPAAYRDKDGIGWAHPPRPRRLCLEGPGEAGSDHLRGARRSEMARQDLHPLRPACLQCRPDRLDDRSHHGEVETEEWLKGVKANLARKPAGDDRMQVKGVYSGECDLAIGNTYYMGAMLKNEKEPEQKEWANSVNMLFPNTNDRGTHVNVSGAVLAKNAPQ